ncbi:hypothetical protein LXL04_018456 [Taraxacum kok-saghyz]
MECGYYVLKFMKAIVDEGLEVLTNNFWEKVTYTDAELDMDFHIYIPPASCLSAEHLLGCIYTTYIANQNFADEEKDHKGDGVERRERMVGAWEGKRDTVDAVGKQHLSVGALWRARWEVDEGETAKTKANQAVLSKIPSAKEFVEGFHLITAILILDGMDKWKPAACQVAVFTAGNLRGTAACSGKLQRQADAAVVTGVK